MPGQYPFSAYTYTGETHRDDFSQRYCSVAPGAAHGNLKRGPGYWPCLVEVTAGNVVLLMQPGNRAIDTAPTDSVQITSPRWLRRLGTGVILAMNGRLWVIDFTRVYQHERDAGSVPALVKSMRYARILTRDFTAALLSAGAVDWP
ncbi:MAG TPA: hypothetical protein VN969_44920 [Streptosporangiaceae bacterium]|nr:hypothetical protein [Streptosporangiaceae bacterium]